MFQQKISNGQGFLLLRRVSLRILKYNVVEKEAAIFTKSTNRVGFPANWAILGSERKQSGTD